MVHGVVTFDTMNNRESAWRNALRQFAVTTTLHGFKYLCSEFQIDRLGWVISCVASTCCAGVLCAVLWARFLDVPALLQLRDMHSNVTLTQFMPQVTVCPPVHSLAGFFQQLNLNASVSSRLTTTVGSILARRSAAEDQLLRLEQLLLAQNLTFTEMMLQNSPTCEDLIKSCRWQRNIVPCKALFEKELTINGVCCIMRPDKAYNNLPSELLRPTTQYQQTRTLDLSLQCSNDTIYGCKFFAKYDAEPNVQTIVLSPEYIYFAQMLFTSVPISSAEEFLETECIDDKSYSQEICLDKCAEKYCGCLDPFRDKKNEKENKLPMCSVTRLGCLRTYADQGNDTCKCIPSCIQITSDINLESTTLNLNTFTIDPIYNGISPKSTVIHLRLSLPLSKIFTLNPTETWLTLLSSLGGVFNMFLGVGLFSALEMLFLLLIKLPNALLKSQFN